MQRGKLIITWPVCVTSLSSAFFDEPDDEEHSADDRIDKFRVVMCEFFKFSKNFREAMVDKFFFLHINFDTLQGTADD